MAEASTRDLPGYRLLGPLGGRSGRVWSAVELATGQRVAVHFCSLDPRNAERLSAEKVESVRRVRRMRFLRKAAVTQQLAGVAGVVRVYCSGVTEQEEPYMVAELIDERQGWESLAERLDVCGELPQAEALRIGEQVAVALGALLHAEVAPSSLSLANVWVRGHGDEVEARLTDADAGIESMGPLMIGGQQELQRGLEALGAVLFEALTGQPPRAHASEAPSARSGAIPVRSLRPELSPSCASVVDGLLGRSISSVAALVGEIGRLCVGEAQAALRAVCGGLSWGQRGEGARVVGAGRADR